MADLFDVFGGTDRTTFHYQPSNTENSVNNTRTETLIIDATISELHSMKSKTTQHEIENGSQITDHIINVGKTIKINGVISDNPFSFAALGVGVVAGLGGSAIGGIGGTIATLGIAKVGNDLISGSSRPSKDSFIALEQIHDEKIAVDIVTGLKEYKAMVMESLDIDKNARNGGALNFACIFRQIRVVESKTVSVPDVQKDPGARASDSAETNNGNTPTKTPNSSVNSKGASWAKQIF